MLARKRPPRVCCTQPMWLPNPVGRSLTSWRYSQPDPLAGLDRRPA